VRPAEDGDWASEEGRRSLQPCPPTGPLPWLAVGPETPMCVDSDGGAAASAQFWQDAYDDAYY
jgi:hypothetical protein